MGLRSFLSSCSRTLRLAVKPSRREIWLALKISFIGISIVGVVGFIIRLIASLLAVVIG